jgi:hypothetical protein
MSDLTRFRDHCRRMAEDCDRGIHHDAHGRRYEMKAAPSGLVTDALAARHLWRMLADEVDAYLARTNPQPSQPTDDDQPLDLEAR